MAILHIILWLIHAVVQALASALVDVFTNVTTAVIALFAVALVFAVLAGAFGIGSFSLFRWFRRRE